VGIFSFERHTILFSKVIVFTLECQSWITVADIKQKFQSKLFFKCVILRSKILQKLGIFPKGALWMRRLTDTGVKTPSCADVNWFKFGESHGGSVQA
jgi:hypothetical protein